MSVKSEKKLDALLPAISHAASGIQMVTNVAGREESGNDIQVRLHEAQLNFSEAARQIASR